MNYNNQIPTTAGPLIVLGGKMKVGLVKLAGILNITQITADEMGTDTDAFASADNAFNDARSAQQAASDAFKIVDTTLTVWLGKARSVLTTFFGNRWTTEWVQAGYITPTTAVPGTIDDRLGLALRLVNFFTANPSYEAPTLGVTAATGTAARAAVVSALEALDAAATDLKQKGVLRVPALNTLTSAMRLLIGVLGEILDANDPRWLAFGLNIPAMLTTPGQPTGVAVATNPTQAADLASNNIGTGSILATCDAVPLATRYRWRVRSVGLEVAYRLAASSTQPIVMINDLPLGVAVEVIVQAVNGNRQGVASDPVVYQPAAKVAAVPASAAGEPKSEAMAATNGSGSNGFHAVASNGNGHRKLVANAVKPGRD